MMHWSRREFLQWAAAGGVGAAITQLSPGGEASAPPVKDRPNIVFLLTDDQRWNSLGCMGDPVLQTPRLDAIARDGVRFRHAYVTTSICCSSRASILTGQYTCRHGILDFASALSAEALEQTYPAVLRRQGYHTGFVGEFGIGLRVPNQAFDFCKTVAHSSSHWVKDEQGNPIHVIDQDTQYALEFLRSCPKDRPFCLSFSYRAPHAEDANPKQYLCKPEDERLYEDVTIPVPKTATHRHFDSLPPFLANEQNEGRKRWHWRFDTPGKHQQYTKAYYRLITGIDRSVGQIVDELKRLGLDRNTVILFAADNGYFLGEHGLADKWYPYQESIRVPLIVYDPRLPADRRGRQLDNLTLNVDIAPSILALAGCPVPASMQGNDFSGLYAKQPPAAWREEFFYEHAFVHPGIPASEALVSRDWKYIRWSKYQHEELFDLRSDPHEERNLAADPRHQERLEILRLRFEACKQRVLQGHS